MISANDFAREMVRAVLPVSGVAMRREMTVMCISLLFASVPFDAYQFTQIDCLMQVI